MNPFFDAYPLAGWSIFGLSVIGAVIVGLVLKHHKK